MNLRSYPVVAPVEGDYTVVERVHADFAGPSAFEQINHAATWLKSRRGYAFQGALLDERGNLLSPPEIDVHQGWINAATGDFVIVGSLAHHALGLADAYDMGAWDGRNMDEDWGPDAGRVIPFPDRQVFIGDASTRSYQMSPVGSDVHALAVSDDGTRFAVLERTGLRSSRLLVGDLPGDGSRRLIGAFEHASDPRFSPDGRWIGIVSRGLTLVDLASMRQVVLSVGVGHASGWDWWPASTPQIVRLVNDETARTVTVRILEVQEDRIHDAATLQIDSSQAMSGDTSVFEPVIERGGTHALVTTRAFSDPGRESDFSPKLTLARLDLATGQLEPLAAPFVDGPDGPFVPNSLAVAHQD